MVARIISGRSIRGAFNYNENKLEKNLAFLLTAENYPKDTQELLRTERLQMLMRQASLNERVKTNCLHISLNFETNEKISNEKMQQITRDYMQKIGFGAQPYLVYRHQDSGHPHLHIVTTNIDPQGDRISLHNLGRDSSEQARQEIELKYNLVKASGRGDDQVPRADLQALRKANYGRQETKKTIDQIVNAIASKYNYISLTELNAVLGRFNIKADRGHEKSNMYKNQGLLYRVTDDQGGNLGVPIKASVIAGKYTLSKLEKRFEKNLAKRKPLAALLKIQLDQILKIHPDQSRFESLLKAQQIELVYRRNQQGMVYGLTYIDHKNRSVFNGSELGKVYSAKALMERLQARHNQKQESAKILQAPNLFQREKPDYSFLLENRTPIPDLLKIDPTALLDTLLRTGIQENYGPLLPRKKTRKKRRQLKI